MSFVDRFVTFMEVPGRFWTLGWIVTIVYLLVAFAPALLAAFGLKAEESRPLRTLSHPALFFALGLLLLLVFKWPALLHPFELNPDESQAIAEALTLVRDPIYPRALIGGDRIIQVYLLAVPGWLGMEITYGLSRFIGFGLFWLASIPLFFAVRLVSGREAASLATAVVMICYAFGVVTDFLSHATELVTLPFLMAACYLFFKFPRSEGRRRLVFLFLLGLALGSVPFAKLQAVPIALTITAFAFLEVFVRNRGTPWKTRFREAAILTAGGCTIPALVMSIFAAFGSFGEYWMLLTESSAAHIEKGKPFTENVAQYLEWLGEREWTYERFLVGLSVFSPVMLLWWAFDGRRRAERPWWALFFAFAVLASSWVALAAPARPFTHYILHTFFPIGLWIGVLLARPQTTRAEDAENEADSLAETSPDMTSAPPTESSRRFVTPWPAFTTFCLLLAPMISSVFMPMYIYHDRKKNIAEAMSEILEYSGERASRVINRLKRPGESLVVWGWDARYYAETQLPPAIRIPVTYFLIEDLPLRDYFREVNLDAFLKNRPEFFIDSVAPDSFFYQDRIKHGVETWPELANHLRSHYLLLADYDGVRVFVRRDLDRRVKEWKPSANP